MDFEKVSDELNNRTIIARLKSGSISSLKYGELFIGRLVGRTKASTGKLEKGIVSVTVLASNYIAYQIPTQDILEITESLM